MTTEPVSFLELLHQLAARNGWAVLLTAQHSPAGFAETSRTELRHLDVVRPANVIQQLAAGAITRGPLNRKQRLRAGELLVRCDVALVNDDLEAASELLLQLLRDLLTHAREQAA